MLNSFEAGLNFVGILFIFFLLWLCSYTKNNIPYKTILKAFIAQFIIAIILLKIPAGVWIIERTSFHINKIISYGNYGLEFVFGSLMDKAKYGNIFILHVLGNIVFIASLVAVLTYLGILGFVVKIFGKIFSRILGTSQIESFISVANVFLGQTESPLLVSKYLKFLTNSEVVMVLVAGMGSMSASILGGYNAMGVPLNFLLITCALVPFGSVIVAKIIMSQNEIPTDVKNIKIDRKSSGENLIEVISNGAMDGIKLVLEISASLIGVIAFVALFNGVLADFGLKLDLILGYIFYPLAFFMGFDATLTYKVAGLLGEKLLLNEFIAFADLMEYFGTLDYKTQVMLCVAIGGFANIGSMAICLSGIGMLCPDKKGVIGKYLWVSLAGAFLMNIMNALIVGIVLSF